MDAKTLEALNASIEKWERNAEATDAHAVKISAWDCPLCKVYVFGSDDSCRRCPVAEKTGQTSCNGSPWEEAFDTLRNWRTFGDSDKAMAEFHEAARAEVAFLKSLLPS